MINVLLEFSSIATRSIGLTNKGVQVSIGPENAFSLAMTVNVTVLSSAATTPKPILAVLVDMAGELIDELADHVFHPSSSLPRKQL
jgi:hypothetical protein